MSTIKKVYARNILHGDMVTIELPAERLTVTGEALAPLTVNGLVYIKLRGIKERPFVFTPDDKITVHVPSTREVYAALKPGDRFTSSGNSTTIKYMKVNDNYFTSVLGNGLPTVFGLDRLDGVTITKVD